jgi:uncharacterized membrane protein YhiD involved in acid resistance
MMETFQTVSDILLRLVAAGLIGGLIGFERRAHHKAIGIAGMVLIAIGSTTFMLLAKILPQSAEPFRAFFQESVFLVARSSSKAATT